MEALITGVAGFIGRHMFETLKRSDEYTEVTGIDIRYGTDVMMFVNECDRRYDLVIHAAAAGPNRAAIDSRPGNFPYNVMLDAAMLEWAHRTQARRFVYLSSSAMYPAALQGEYGYRTTADRGWLGDRRLAEYQGFEGPPFDTYGETKRIGERMAQAIGIPVHIVRPFSGYGADQSEDYPFNAIVQRVISGQQPVKIWGSTQQVRDFVHIDDVCDAIMAVIKADFREPVNICTGTPTTLAELAFHVAKACRRRGSVELAGDPTAPTGVLYRVGDPKLLHRIYEPKITLKEGVRRAVYARGY